MLRAGAALVTALVIAAAPAAAKTHRWSWQVKASPITVKVDFYGDAAAGCADHGVCQTFGTATYQTPKLYGVLNGRLDTKGFAAYGLAVNLDEPAQLVVSAATRGTEEPCRDSTSGLLTLFGIDRSRRFVLGSIPKGAFPGFGSNGPFADFLASRCLGPTGADVANGLAMQRMPNSFVKRKTLSISLDHSASFSGGGFAGTVTTTGRMTLRK